MDLSGLWRGPMRLIKSKFEKVDTFRNQKYEKIKKRVAEQDALFTDLTFPASAESLGINPSSTSTAIEWKRPGDLSDSPRLFTFSGVPGGTQAKIQPGELSSNWMVSAFRILSGVKELCYKIIVNYSDQEWDPDGGAKYTGLFRFRFWRFGRWVEVVVDDLLPTIDGKLVFTHSSSKDEFWVSLVEKAYAKLVGSYDDLEEGHISDALVDMTGGVSEIIDLRSRECDSSDENRLELFQLLTKEMADHSIVCASIMAHSADEVGQRTEVGLIRGQAYHITAVKRIHLGDLKIRNLFKGREKVAMVRLKDAGARKSAENSPSKSTASNAEDDGYAYSTSQLTKLLSKNSAWAKMKESEKERIGLSADHDGEFWMPLEDFVTNLEELAIVRLFNNNIFARSKGWHESSVKGCWTVGDKGSTTDRSGGGNTNSDAFLRNPQYLFRVGEEEEEITVQMLQWDGVEPSTPVTDSQTPRPHHRTLLIGFSIIKVEINRKYRLHKVLPFCQTMVTMDHQRKRELFYRGFFPRGKYLLVPTTFKPCAEGSFLIRIFSQENVKLREVQRDGPTRMRTFSCLSSPAVWVTVIGVKGAVGLGTSKNIYYTLKCENQKVKSEISKNPLGIEWSDMFIFYRKNPENPVVIKVYSRQMFLRNKFIGWTEIPAPVNHSLTQLEANLLRKDNNPIENAIIKLEVLTEDNLTAI